MKKPSRLKHLVPVALALAVLAVIAARAGGPLYVGGPSVVPGVPFRWIINPVTYWTDQGSLGLKSNAEADALVAEAFQVWQDVPTANISFAKDASNNGKLGADVDHTNIAAVLDSIEGCGLLGGIAKDRSIIYDMDGSAVAALLGEENRTTVLGFATPACAGTNGVDSNYYLRGYAVLNGIFLDGAPPTPSNPEVSVTGFKAVMIHEFGHLIGLDHSQINLHCLTSYCAPGSDDLEGVPTMFPVLIDAAAMSTLATDDIAAISALYPESTFATSTGRITGQVLFSDGETAAQGFNVIARRVGDPLVTAVSSVSGFLFTACEGNPVTSPPYNDCGLDITPFGSRDPALIGYYDLPGLPPGDYTVEVEAIHNSEPIPFVLGSGLGPLGDLGFQFPLPSLLPTPPPCTLEYLVSSATATCSSAVATPIPVVAGSPVSTGTDVILIGTPPRYDAWEDVP